MLLILNDKNGTRVMNVEFPFVIARGRDNKEFTATNEDELRAILLDEFHAGFEIVDQVFTEKEICIW